MAPIVVPLYNPLYNYITPLSNLDYSSYGDFPHGFPTLRVPVWGIPITVQRVENARREAREVCSNVKITGRRGIFCSARSPGGRAGRRKNSEKNPANCAAAVVSRARRRLSMPGAAYSAGRAVVFSMTVWTCSLRETSNVLETRMLLWFRHGCS